MKNQRVPQYYVVRGKEQTPVTKTVEVTPGRVNVDLDAHGDVVGGGDSVSKLDLYLQQLRAKRHEHGTKARETRRRWRTWKDRAKTNKETENGNNIPARR